jgi:DNA-binding winged helix-turn-helix (wHTH) protein
MQTKTLSFPPFHLDLANEQPWRDSQVIPLRPKTFAVLRYLVEHAGGLVTKDELLHAVWAGTQVSEAGQRDYIRELRQALGDDSRAPRFIETVHGRGYRFIAPLSLTAQPASSSKFQVENPQSAFRNPPVEAEACFQELLRLPVSSKRSHWSCGR